MLHETIIGYMLAACIFALIIFIVSDYRFDKKHKSEEKDKVNSCKDDSSYVAPKFKELTKEQIDDIHARGKITPKEKVKEWEDMDLCAPGDAIGSAAPRCKKFHHNCHDCLVDYANNNDEYTSFYDALKIVNSGVK